MKKSCIGCDSHKAETVHPLGLIHFCKAVRMKSLLGGILPEPHRAIGNPNKRPAWCPKEAR